MDAEGCTAGGPARACHILQRAWLLAKYGIAPGISGRLRLPFFIHGFFDGLCLRRRAVGKNARDILEQIKGFVSHIIYRNAGNGYTVFVLNAGEEVTCVGTFQSLDEGELLELDGEYTEHAVYGSQFKVSGFRIVSPEDAAGMERYLGSGAVKGVGASLAARIGIHTDSDFRIRSGILYTLLQASGEGHVYLPGSLLVRRAAALLGLPEEAVEDQLPNLSMDKKLVIKKSGDDTLCYASSYYYAELSCARMLSELNQSMVPDGELLPGQEDQIYRRIEKIQEQEGLMLDGLQKQAVLESVKNSILILTGGPGTGKTTTINTIIRYFESEGLDLFLAAPTGRAAKRMTEATGYEARTIHRMLELSGAVPEEGRRASFERNEENPLEADVIIVDEMSMVDIHLFNSLLKAVSPGTRLILVGDVNQLPSVGPGQVLSDLIKSEAFPVVRLQKIFRQAQESDIVVNAHRINRGEQIALGNKSRDFFFLERSSVPVMYKHMVQLISQMLPPYVKAHPYDIQVLTPMRKGSLGVETLNGVLQSCLNAPDASKKEAHLGDTLFREGDKVMQTKNNYQLEWEIVSRYGIPIDKGVGIFNGDMGVIKEINEYAQTVLVEFEEQRRVTYSFSQMEEVELAYAITIHKSQGSEYPAVIMPLLGGPRMLFNRNLLYTGVTRAKDCVTILGSREVVEEMIENESETKRYTSLDVRIREMKGEACSV